MHARRAVNVLLYHDDVIKWKHFPRYWSFVRGIHRSPVNSQHTGQWRGALVFSLICVWINDWVNKRGTGELRRYRAHHDVIVMIPVSTAVNAWIGNYIIQKSMVAITSPWPNHIYFILVKTHQKRDPWGKNYTILLLVNIILERSNMW